MKPEASRQTFYPVDETELSTLIRECSGQVAIIGSGSDEIDSHYSSDITVISTVRLTNDIVVSIPNQTVTVSAGTPIRQLKARLKHDNLFVTSLTRFDNGTVGGRLASVSSHPQPNETDGWIQSLLGLTVVLPTGDIVNTGSESIKDVAGYDLRHLFTGCRGATGVIVCAIFRCYPIKKDSINQAKPINARLVDPTIRRLFDPSHRMHLTE